ncbi:MAG: DUF4398 domain-containing protein [Acidobacteria bacterium]|nr:DUF4398 domain-containing protein [Acidobacteriota bacterium]
MSVATCWLRPGLAVMAGLALLGCDQPPTREIAAAEAAVGQARQEGAGQYAADRFREAETALSDAQRKVQEKDYRGALSSATHAAERARTASQAAAAARTVARSAAEVAKTEVLAVLDEVGTIREEAVTAKVPDEAFEEVAPRVGEVQQSLDAVARLLDSGDLLGAQQAATDLKARAVPLPGLFRGALERWQAEHPKGRRGKPAVRKK